MESSTSLKGSENCVLEQYLRPDAVDFCNPNMREIFTFWLTLKLDTSVSDGMGIPDVMAALATIEGIICNTEHYWQRRLAYVQLMRVLHSLEKMMHFRVIASRVAPKRLSELMRKPWDSRLDSLFLAVAYSDCAEVMVKNFSTTQETLRDISKKAVHAVRQEYNASTVFPI
ncbi:hypothetical protein BBAD15_g2646 [Beauveria bassiana D1-5]|uniref:Uncharacterized protein n=1 Tax=Beauveria bassiana D1-5 TaxID=1245745 RepID=A0A0A2VUQ0_BEABA|nr:hypothetical protein BBAD15_g2646 [Beauveria bassiana D1-5]